LGGSVSSVFLRVRRHWSFSRARPSPAA